MKALFLSVFYEKSITTFCNFFDQNRGLTPLENWTDLVYKLCILEVQTSRITEWECMLAGSSGFCKVWWWAVQQLDWHRSKGQPSGITSTQPLSAIILWLQCFLIKEFDPGGEQSLFSNIYLSKKLLNSSSDQLIRFWRFGNSYSIMEFANNNRLARFQLDRRRHFDSTYELFPDRFYHA